MSSFQLTNQAFDNGTRFTVRHCKLDEFAPVDELVREVGAWFQEIRDEEEDWAPLIRSRLWRLRTTVLCSLLPFADPELGLQGTFDSLRSEAMRLPPLRDRVGALGIKLQALIDRPENPKRSALDTILSSVQGGVGLGLVTALARAPLPGWAERLRSEIREAAPCCRFISSSKLLRSRSWDRVILLTGSHWCPLLYELHHCACTATLDLVTYSAEQVTFPPRKRLPTARGVVTSLGSLSASHVPPQRADHAADEIGQNALWQVARRTALNGASERASEGASFLVPARLLLLANNSQVLLEERSKVIEISALDTDRDVLARLKRFPRRFVSELEGGDLIVLRTSGSGDYLIDAADSLLKAHGKGRLRETALDWKPVLRRALEEQGPAELAQRLAARGHSVTNPGYIWMWTTHLVIRPRSESQFYELMAILEDLGYQFRQENLIDYVETRWRAMKEIILYHHKAGIRIRNSLLSRLRDIVAQGTSFEDEYRLTLPGLDAGELAVFRVAAVDTQKIDAPYNQIGVLRSTDP